MRRFPLVFVLILATIPFASINSANAAVNATTIYSMDYPDALAEDSAGNIYIVDNATTGKIGIVVVPASTGTLFGQSVTAGSAMTLVTQQDSLPSGVTVSSSGVLVWSLRNGDIYALSNTSEILFGVSISAWSVTLIKAATTLVTGLDFDPAGNLFGVINTPGSFSVLPVESGTLFGQSVTANTSKELFTDGNHWFWDAAVDSLGNLYLADGWGDVAIGRGIFVLPKVTGTLYGQSVTANTLTRLTTFGTTIYASIDVDGSDVLFANPYSGQTKALSAVNVSIFNIAFTANIATAIPATSGYAWTGLLVTSTGALILGGYLATYKLVYTPDVTAPGSPTIGSALALSPTSASISFTAPTSNGGSAINLYTATSTPGSITGSVSQSGSGTITVSGLTASTAYTFRVTATNSVDTSTASSASNSITLPSSQAEIDTAALAAQKAAEAKREAEKKAARLGIYNNFIYYNTPTIQMFNTAEIYGVNAKNYYYVTNEIQYLMWKYNKIYSGQDIKALAYLWNYNSNSVMWNYQTNTLVRDESATALSWNLNSTMHIVENVVLKYSIMDSMCQPGRFSQYYAYNLSSVGLIPSKYQTLITYRLRKTPFSQRDDYYKITTAINRELAVIRIREQRLAALLALRKSRQVA
jgi:hypothetical protein